MNKRKIGTIIADTFLYLGLFVYLCIIINCIICSIQGVPTGLFGQSETLYGLEGFYHAFFWNILFFCLMGVIPAIILYDIIYVIIKCKRKLLKKYQTITVCITFIMSVISAILFCSKL